MTQERRDDPQDVRPVGTDLPLTNAAPPRSPAAAPVLRVQHPYVTQIRQHLRLNPPRTPALTPVAADVATAAPSRACCCPSGVLSAGLPGHRASKRIQAKSGWKLFSGGECPWEGAADRQHAVPRAPGTEGWRCTHVPGGRGSYATCPPGPDSPREAVPSGSFIKMLTEGIFGFLKRWAEERPALEAS